MRLPVMCLLLASTLLATAQSHPTHTKPIAVQETSTADPLAPLDFLLGTWNAITGSEGSAGAHSSGTYTFRRDLGGHVLTRTSSTDTCAGPKSFDCQHHDQLTVFPDSATHSLVALYLDSEGHVIHYAVTVPDPHTAVFLSTDPGAHFRLVYELENGIMTGKFQFLGDAGFHSYLEWSGKKL